jgi:hypothetical protein
MKGNKRKSLYNMPHGDLAFPKGNPHTTSQNLTSGPQLMGYRRTIEEGYKILGVTN